MILPILNWEHVSGSSLLRLEAPVTGQKSHWLAHNMAMLAMQDPTITGVIDTRDYSKKREVAFSFYILWMCAHAFARRQKKVLDDNEWA